MSQNVAMGKFSRADLERGRRLMRIRTRLHNIPQSKYAEQLGLSPNQYNNWERGHPITVDGAEKIKDATPGVDGDYILWGDESGLSVSTLQKLRQEPEKP